MKTYQKTVKTSTLKTYAVFAKIKALKERPNSDNARHFNTTVHCRKSLLLP